MRKPGDLPLNTEEIARVKQLSGLGRSARAIARELHRSPHTIARLLRLPVVAVEVQKIKGDLSQTFEGLAERLLASITDGDIAKLDGYKKTLSAAIAADKSLVLKGAPNVILGVEVLLQVARALRRQDDEADEEAQRAWQAQHTLPSPPSRSLPAPSAEPAPTSIPAPAPSQKRVETPPPVRYTPVIPGVHPDHEPPENPLLRGLRHF
ncbi:MAG TPA: hypothetical protein VJY15_03110 [Candidatus Acidoferrum sp.]|nr:hypothetical protein [Candidatus Acidoferrum sp.]